MEEIDLDLWCKARRRTADHLAQWRDRAGKGPNDYPADSPCYYCELPDEIEDVCTVCIHSDEKIASQTRVPGLKDFEREDPIYGS